MAIQVIITQYLMEIEFMLRASNPSQLEQSIISKRIYSPNNYRICNRRSCKPGNTNIRANSPIRQSILKAGGYTFRATNQN